MPLHIVLLQLHIPSFNDEFAAARHGVARINRKIHDYLFDLDGISLDSSQLFAGNHRQFDIFANKKRQHFGDVPDDQIQIEKL